MLWYGSDDIACSLGVLDVVILWCLLLHYGLCLENWVLGDVCGYWLVVVSVSQGCRCGIFQMCLCVFLCDVQYISCVFYGCVVTVFFQFVLGIVRFLIFYFLFPLKGVYRFIKHRWESPSNMSYVFLWAVMAVQWIRHCNLADMCWHIRGICCLHCHWLYIACFDNLKSYISI